MKRQSWFSVLTFLATFFAVACGAGDKMPYDWNDDGVQRDTQGNPRPRLGWSAAGSVCAGRPQQTVSLQAQFAEPGAYTASFNVKYPDTVDSPIVAEAEIEWTVAGNSVKRRISVADGTSVTGVAEAVRIVANVPGNFTGVLGTPAEFPLSMQVAKGTRGSFTNPPVLRDVDASEQILNGASKTWAVPDDAGVTGFKMLTATSLFGVILDNGIQVTQQDAFGYTLGQCDPRDHEWVPLMPGATSVIFTNMSGVSVEVAIVWSIDG